MYYLFSMKEQQATLDLVRQALVLGGFAMVLMVGGVAWLVSRQVLNPVRLARRIAERYAAGSLEQRMHVSGEDDIARLSTSFNQMAASLQSQIRRLENLSRLQQRFVSDVSHELRTPLTTVQMASGVLFDARQRFDPQTARSAELLKGELDRFEELLSNLLDLSRFDAGAAQLELDAVDLAAVAREAAGDPLLGRLGIDVRLVGTDEPAVVEADIRRIDRIVRNLLTNAAKYSGSPVIEIEVAQDDDHVSLAVRDFGVGLSGDENLRVFDRFWRADPARSQGGTGLGLPISREDAVLHGGSLHAWGRPGEGSEFVLTLPRTVPSAEEQKDGPGGPAPVVRSVFA
jgi:two-component system sensor histidine kinase MtrB